MSAIGEKLSLDPREEVEVRLEVARYMLQRAREELEKGDAVRASEKLYKMVEECIKVLACLEGLEECRRTREEGQWWTRLLARAASRLSRILGEPVVLEAWGLGYDAHVHGFHEHGLEVDDLRQRLAIIEKLVAITEKVVREARTSERRMRYKEYCETSAAHLAFYPLHPVLHDDLMLLCEGEPMLEAGCHYRCSRSLRMRNPCCSSTCTARTTSSLGTSM